MYRTFLTLLTLCWAGVGLAEDSSSSKCPSPDGRFALRLTALNEKENSQRKVELIEKASGKVLVDLGTVMHKHLPDTVVVWSADSKWVAYATREDKTGDTSTYFWNSSAFEEIPLPFKLPTPDLKIPKTAGHLKAYGGATRPLRWTKSGDLELSSDAEFLDTENGIDYQGVVSFTIAFDAKHHASVKKVGKTKTKTD